MEIQLEVKANKTNGATFIFLPKLLGLKAGDIVTIDKVEKDDEV